MFLTYAYEIEGPAVLIRGALQVEFDFLGGYGRVDDYAENFRATADSADIIDDKGQMVNRVELLTDEQRANWGAVVLKDCLGDITEACEAEGAGSRRVRWR